VVDVDEFDSDLRSRIFDLLTGDLTLDELVEWFAGESWDARTDLAADLDLLLAEREAISEAEFHERLRMAASTVEISLAPVLVRTATGDETLTVRLRPMGTETIRGSLVFAGT